jgi:hypothetical protein
VGSKISKKELGFPDFRYLIPFQDEESLLIPPLAALIRRMNIRLKISADLNLYD